MRNKLIIINYGCSDLNNLNPNSAAIIALAFQLSNTYNIDIITDNLNNENIIDCYDNGHFRIHSFPTTCNNGRKIIDVNSSQCVKYLEDNINIKNGIACIAVSYPFYPSIKVMNLLVKMNKSMKRIIYEFDPLAFNGASNLNIGSRLIRIALESFQFFIADSIWLTKELFDHYNKNVYKIFKNKFNDIGIPLLHSDTIYSNSLISLRRERSKFNLVYTGTFYDGIRSPKHLIELIYRIDQNYSDEFVFHIYGAILGDESIRILNEASVKLKGKLILHGIVNRKEIPKILLNADILINVGNTVRNQLPSKVFEYIETCKPIINISSVSCDSSNFYLERYPICLSLNESFDDDKIKSNAKEIVNFCKQYAGKLVNPTDVVNLYNDFLVSNIASNISDVLSELDKN